MLGRGENGRAYIIENEFTAGKFSRLLGNISGRCPAPETIPAAQEVPGPGRQDDVARSLAARLAARTGIRSKARPVAEEAVPEVGALRRG